MLDRLSKHPEHIAATLLLLAVTAIFAWRAHHGIWFSAFGDETGHIIGAKSIASGYVLYRDFIDEHGPLIYALPQLYGFLFGWSQPNYVRMMPIALMVVTTLCIAFSQCLCGYWERIASAAGFVGLLTTAWLIQAIFMVNYQPFAGMFILIGVAQFTLPAWLGARVGKTSLLLSGFSFAVVPFIAFTYGPTAVLFVVSGLWACFRSGTFKTVGFLVAGGLAGVALSVGWMAAFADFRGYLAYHFIAALYYYLPYQHAGFGAALRVLWPTFSKTEMVQDTALVASVIAFALFLLFDRRDAAQRNRRILPILLGVPALILTNPRGSTIFQDGAFVVVAYGLAAIALARVPSFFPAYRRFIRMAATLLLCATILGAEALARNALGTPHGYTRAQMPGAENGCLSPSQKSWAQKLRLAADPVEPTLALPFYPDFYLLADRLPMKAYFLYLPWDADFGRHPVLGLSHDLCHDLAQTPPPAIYYNGWVVWGKYDPKIYMPCVLNILARNYQPMPGEEDIYIRNDRLGRLHPPESRPPSANE